MIAAQIKPNGYTDSHISNKLCRPDINNELRYMHIGRHKQQPNYQGPIKQYAAKDSLP